MGAVLWKLTGWRGGSEVPQEPPESKRGVCGARVGVGEAREVCPEEEAPSRAWDEGRGGLSFLSKAAWLEGHTLWVSGNVSVKLEGLENRVPERDCPRS